jgi:hypothetical protein
LADIGTFINSITKIAKKHYLALIRNIDKDIKEVVNEWDYYLIAYKK